MTQQVTANTDIETKSPAQLAFEEINAELFSGPLQRLSQADPSKVQEIAATQIELLNVYHGLVLEQARSSFRWALIAAGIGLGFFLASVSFLLIQQPSNISVTSLISGTLIEVISAINFYLYGKTSAQLADFQTRLEMIQRFLLSNSICEGLEADFKQRARLELVRAIAGINRSDTPGTEQKAA